MNEFWLPTSIGPVREHFSNVHDGWIMSPGMPDWAAYHQSVIDELEQMRREEHKRRSRRRALMRAFVDEAF